ncbi:FAD-dependent oxidoreductase [Virgisporangium aliadipatigenens]|uniref:FAD-dependent oxidoreductase n=1 Tax=Virgisporangium aliadipatigenens TaxID=741659 RepID=A0A8J3YV44_9ACTN|nr:FAD-binding oxidoreductase [Virgisporangium aliadipatigenens]GIJ51078.1 FAD-dependent oxidoreductase [Virgisporangium aliadipatigenens]
MEPDLTGPLWASTVDVPERPALDRDIEADVAIVGGGYTGLWTAYYLSTADPALRIAVLEAARCGFGASGRNGGWCSALFPASPSSIARRYGRDAAVALYAAMRESVDEVGRVSTVEGIDCGFVKGGTVSLARTTPQLERARAEVAEAAGYGLGVTSLSAGEAAARCAATGVLGGTFTPHCARIHPGRLVRGLSTVVAARGVAVYERTRALRIAPGRVVTTGGEVRAPVVVRATEGYTPGLPGLRRAVAPVYSLMIATPPLPDDVWSAIGLAGCETFTDYRHLIVYGQRTVDGRLAFGGRGAPYHFGSRVRPEHDHEPRVFAELRRVLVDLFPVLDEVSPTHRWGGPLGVPRDWTASVDFDRATGLARAGGYVGDGVTTSNLAGRTLADLITGRSSDLTRLPWVGHRSPRWEPEPLRWLAVNAVLKAMTAADAAEEKTDRPSRRAALLGRFLGS